jgi:hypothetical protein
MNTNEKKENERSLYYIATGCIHPEEKYQFIPVNGWLSQGHAVMNYLNKDIAWRVSLNCAERHLPSRKYVKTGKLYHPDETFDPKIHKITNRNVRSVCMDKIIYFYPDLQDQEPPKM